MSKLFNTRIYILGLLAFILTFVIGCSNKDITNIQESEIEPTEKHVFDEPVAIAGRKGIDGQTIIATHENTFIEIDCDCKEAYLTPDQTKYMYLDTTGTLIVIDRTSNVQTTINRLVEEICCVTDTTLVYKTPEKSVYCYDYQNRTLSLFAENVKDIDISNNKKHIACITNDDQIRFSNIDGKEVLMLPTEYSNLWGINILDDGKTIIYGATAENGNIIIIYGESFFVIDNFKDSSYYLYPMDNNDFILLNGSKDELWTQSADEQLLYYNFKDIATLEDFYSESGSFYETNILSANCIYFIERTISDKSQLYCKTIGSDTPTLIVDDIVQYDIEASTIAYTDNEKNKNLFYIQMVEGKFSSPTYIAESADVIVVSDDGKYIYYGSYYDERVDDIGTLYCYSLETNQSLLVSEDVFLFINHAPVPSSILTFDGGATFYKDFHSKGYGTLMKWNTETQKVDEIDKNVILHSVSSSLGKYAIDPDKFIYAKLRKIDKDGNHIATLKRYNSQRPETIYSKSKTRSYSTDIIW